MYSPRVVIGARNYGGPDLFRQFNEISTLMYEGTGTSGRLILTNPEDGAVNMLLKFR